jgi:hypothetical protein
MVQKFVFTLQLKKMTFQEELNGDFYPSAKSKSNRRVFRSPQIKD